MIATSAEPVQTNRSTFPSEGDSPALLACYRALIENGAEGIATIDLEGCFRFHSSAARRILGVEPDALIGQPFYTSIHPQDRAAAIDDFRRVLALPDMHVTSQFRVLHGDGSWRWILSRKTNLLHNPDVGAVVSNYHDITGQRESERALRESEERFREMAAHIKVAFFVTDAETRIPLYVSPYWSEIFARPVTDAYRRTTAIETVHPDDAADARVAFLRSFGGESMDHMFRIVRPDGEIRWIRVRAYPVYDQTNVVRRIVGVVTDVTDLREAEERFAQAQKMEAVGRLAGGVAHDFNNLLTVIIAETDLMIDDQTSDKKDVPMLKEVRSAAESAVVLTRQLLAFSRRELVEPTVFGIDDAVQQTTKMLRRLIGEDIQLTVKLSSAGASVRMDRGQLEQVLTNLVVNSRDAMPRGGALVIETSVEPVASRLPHTRPARGRQLVLSVSDNGCGMPPEVCSRAFEPFFTTKCHGKGTGLGLATCHGIIAQAGGEISLTSKIDVGTTFRIVLPVADDTTVESSEAAPRVTRGSETILFVEDDAAVRRVGARMLRAHGYSVFEARDASEALRIVTAGIGNISLLLTDVVMPGMGGRELAELVRRERPDIRVMYASGYTDDMILQHQVLENGVPLLRKPYTSTVLAQKVREALDAPAS